MRRPFQKLPGVPLDLMLINDVIFWLLAKGPGVAPVINSSEKGLIIFGNVPLSAKLEYLLKQA